jgi:hypothetical protein
MKGQEKEGKPKVLVEKNLRQRVNSLSGVKTVEDCRRKVKK